MVDASPDADADARSARSLRRRVLPIVGMLALAGPILLLGIRQDGHRGGAGEGAGSGSGRIGTVRAPDGPRLAQPGSGALELPGVVVDASGAPIAGASVTAELELGPGDRSPGRGATDPARGATTPDAAPPPAVVIATSDGDGRFALVGLEPGRHRLIVEGTEIFTAEVRFVPVPSDDVRIVVARRVQIAGRVVDAGQPVVGATVEISGDSIAGRRTTTTTADGAFAFDVLPEGTFQVWGWQGDLAARAQRVPRLGAGPFAPVLLVVEPATIVVGRVIDRDGGAGVVAAVELRPLDPSSGIEPEAARYARTATDGVFRIEGVPHGRWTADAWSPGWVTVGTVEFEAGRGVPEVELVAGGVIEGKVVDDQGRPIAGASVRAAGVGAGSTAAISARDVVERLRRYSGMAPARLAVADPDRAVAETPGFVRRGELGVLLGPIPYPPPPGARASRQASIIDDSLHGAVPAPGDPIPLAIDPALASPWISDAEGRFRITGLPRATVTVFATAAGLAEGWSAPIATAPGRTIDDVAITLSPGAFLLGRVTDQRGTAVIGATIAVAPRSSDDPARVIETVTAADGGYRVGPLIGVVSVVATAYAHGDARVDVELPRPSAGGTAPIELRRDLVLVVADAVLTGVVEDAAGLPVRGATVSIAACAAAGRSAVTSEAGFVIAMLPPGPLVVRIDHPDFPPREVETTTDGVAHLVLPWGGGIDGQVFDHHTGAAVGGVVVTATGPGGAREEAAVAVGGRFELGPLTSGIWHLAVSHPGYLPVERSVEVRAGDRAGAITVHDVRLELERGALVAGIVRDRYGTRVAAATVTARRAAGAGPTVTARTDADGAFRIRDAPTGELVVSAEHRGAAGRLEVTTAPGDELLSLVLELR
jgi:hypothetical protein